MEDREAMRLALELAEKGRGTTSPNPLVGAVILDKDGELVGSGFHRRAGEPHAEVLALEQAGERARGGTLYVTLEPCCHQGRTPPCTEAIIRHGLERVAVAILDPNPLVDGKGVRRLRENGVRVEVGLCKARAKKQNEVFLKYITSKLPFVTLKVAMTLDGKVATRTGRSRWITSQPARKVVHRLRGEHDAVMVGIGTVLADDPLLTVRLTSGKNPTRIIVDSRLRLPLSSRLVATAREVPTLVLTGELKDPKSAMTLEERGLEVVPVASGHDRVSLQRALQVLGHRGITSILLEGGPTLAAAFLEEGAIDKFLFFVAPKLLGGAGAPGPIGGLGAEDTGQAQELLVESVEPVGPDWLVTAYPKKGVAETCSPA